MQAQDDLPVDGGELAAHRHGPRLEQLGGGALHDGVAEVPPVAVGRLLADAGEQPAAVRTQVDATQAGVLCVAQVRHRPREGPVHVLERLAGHAGGLPVHRCQHGDLRGRAVAAELGGDRGVHVVLACGPCEPRVPRDGGEDARLHLTEVPAYEDAAGLGAYRRSELGREVVQPRLSGHPAGSPVGGVPRSTEPAIVGDVAVEPGVPVRRGDPLGLAPGQQGSHCRRAGSVRLEPPGPRVGYV